MNDSAAFADLLESMERRLDERLDMIDERLGHLSAQRQKALEWVGTLSDHINSLDAFREEVRATLEPLFGKLQNMDDVMRIMRHATSDVSRRIESIERGHQLPL